MNPNPAKPSTAYYVQSILSFSLALAIVIVGEICLPLPPWTRAFLALGTVFLVSSCFTLAKCVRDQQETETVVSRLDQARIDRLLADFDPYRLPTVPERSSADRADVGLSVFEPPPSPGNH
jgi:hypothetical protein